LNRDGDVTVVTVKSLTVDIFRFTVTIDESRR